MKDNTNSPWYKIQVTPIEEGTPHIFNVQTPDLEWTMEQYQRNREPFNWKQIN